MDISRPRRFWTGLAIGIAAGVLPVVAAIPAASSALGSVGDYGWLVLVVLPFFMGLGAMLMIGWRREAGLLDGVVSFMWSMLIFGIVALLSLKEGAVCILMAVPITVPLGLLGVGTGLAALRLVHDRKVRMQMSGLVLVLPLGVKMLIRETSDFEERMVTTTSWIAAPPDQVWPYLENMESLPEPDWWLFRLGVAHPIATRTEGNVRHCVLSTGDMPERLVARDPSRFLAWKVDRTPPCVREANPFGKVRAPHDQGRFVVRSGEWRLMSERGGTRVVAKTQYGHRFGAPLYWNLWTDAVVAHVHWRMLGEIKRRAQK